MPTLARPIYQLRRQPSNRQRQWGDGENNFATFDFDQPELLISQGPPTSAQPAPVGGQTIRAIQSGDGLPATLLQCSVKRGFSRVIASSFTPVDTNRGNPIG